MLTFTKTEVKRFRHANKSLRYGQAFHQFMRLDKCIVDKNFCDRLYNEQDDDRAKSMIASRTDKHN